MKQKYIVIEKFGRNFLCAKNNFVMNYLSLRKSIYWVKVGYALIQIPKSSIVEVLDGCDEVTSLISGSCTKIQGGYHIIITNIDYGDNKRRYL